MNGHLELLNSKAMTKISPFARTIVVICIGILGRLIPHLPNATPLTALIFASTIHVGTKWSRIATLCILFVSDIFLGFYDIRIMLSVYLSFMFITFMSSYAKKYSHNRLVIFSTVIVSSLLFFLITNGAVWLFSPWYEKSLSGLLYAYELGIPFFRNMLVGDVVYSTLILGIATLASKASHKYAFKNTLPSSQTLVHMFQKSKSVNL